MEFSIRENIFFFILLQSGTYLASCWPVVLCRCVLLKWRQTMNHIYIILLPVSTLWYIICSLFNHALVLSEFLSQSKFPITSCESFWSLVIANFSSPKNAWSPPLHLPSYFPINQWNYFRNPHYRVVTKGIPLTTVVLFVEFIAIILLLQKSSFMISINTPHPNYTQDNCMYNHELKGFEIFLRLPSKMVVCVKHSLMWWGSDPRTSQCKFPRPDYNRSTILSGAAYIRVRLRQNLKYH